MKILFLYPQHPETFWSFKHALKLISKKALMPPLGLLTIASMLPESFEKRLVDMNISQLEDKDILWADYIFISAMIIQKESVKEIIKRSKNLGAKIVAGGPLFISHYEEFPDVDHFVLDEGEVTLPLLLENLKSGTPKRLYTSDVRPDITLSPVPLWKLVEFNNYFKMPVQTSRGCPFDCEFCDIVKLNGKIPRTKTPLQVIRELNALIRAGWKGSIFIADDNFIGNKTKTKQLLKVLIRWRKLTKQRTGFMTEVSLNLADDEELLVLMRDAGFDSVFIGLETPSEESLRECGKMQNRNRDLLSSVNKIQSYGMEVSGGFIVGFDSDDSSIFARQIEFIQKAGIVVAMISLLQALPGTKLYDRLKNEDRLLVESFNSNTDYTVNFVPKIDLEMLIKGYKSIISSIYSPQKYYERVQIFLSNYNAYYQESITFDHILALIKSIWILGIVEKERKYYWRLLFNSLFNNPKNFTKAIALVVYYVHFKTIFPKLELDECALPI